MAGVKSVEGWGVAKSNRHPTLPSHTYTHEDTRATTHTHTDTDADTTRLPNSYLSPRQPPGLRGPPKGVGASYEPG